MTNKNLIIFIICIHAVSILCFNTNRLQKRHIWFDANSQSPDDYLRKISHEENLLNEIQPTINGVETGEIHPDGLQKRGRQCLWKVCSWALDKRAPSRSTNRFFSSFY